MDALESPAGYEKTRTVVHVHATRIPEISSYIRVGQTVAALPALSRDLADVTAECLGLKTDGTLEFDIVGQANHGVCAVATDPWAAYEHIERLDHICEIVLKSGVDLPPFVTPRLTKLAPLPDGPRVNSY